MTDDIKLNDTLYYVEDAIQNKEIESFVFVYSLKNNKGTVISYGAEKHRLQALVKEYVEAHKV